MESWETLADALAKAVKALSSDNQVTIDKASQTLETAITALVKLDRSVLERALDEAADFANSDESNRTWFELIGAVNDGKALLGSNDQTAIEDAAKEINDKLAVVRATVDALKTPQIVTKEVMVEVPPADDYCNIPGHRGWPVLFFCSLAVNVALVAVIVIYISRKKKNQTDDTPLVDYDIDDDIF